MLLQQFGVPDARKLDLRAPTNGNHATKRIFQPFRLPRTSKHRRMVNRLCLCRNDLPTSMKKARYREGPRRSSRGRSIRAVHGDDLIRQKVHVSVCGRSRPGLGRLSRLRNQGREPCPARGRYHAQARARYLRRVFVASSPQPVAAANGLAD